MLLKKKKAFTVLTAVCMIFCITSCTQTVEFKTIEPPENGWTHEQISEVTYLCGKPFSLPCKLEDLPNEFEINSVDFRDDFYINVNEQSSSVYSAHLRLNDESAGLAHYYENGEDKIVFCIDLSQDLYERDILVINGINQNSLFSDVKQALGDFFVLDTDYPIPCFYDLSIADSEYPEEHIRVMIINDYEGITDDGIIDEGIIGFSYSLFKAKRNND